MAHLRTAPRKRPRQDRSRRLVSALLTATARVLVKWGYDGASTNRIAQVAGVSVGSVYQYFSSKESLIAALIDSHVEQQMNLFRHSLTALNGPDLRSGIRAIVEALLVAHSHEPQLHAVLSEQVPKVGRMKRMHEIDQEAAQLIMEKLTRHRPRLRPKNLALAAFMIVHGVEGILHALAVDKTNPFRTDEVLSELTSLVVNYLAPPAS